jgi:hypothetical protein
MGFRQVFHGRWMLDLPGESAARLTKHAERTAAARILLLLAILYVSLQTEDLDFESCTPRRQRMTIKFIARKRFSFPIFAFPHVTI